MKTVAVWLPLMVITLWAATTTAEDKKLSDATSLFSLELLKDVFSKQKENVIMSPLSVSTLLVMIQQGALNTTAAQMEKVLHLTKEESVNGYGPVIQNFQKRKYKSKLEVSNKIFINSDFDVVPAFNSVLHTTFDTSAERLNFKEPAEASGRINQWVTFSSKNRITELIKPELLSARTQMVLANVIYFKGVWSKTFASDRTVNEDFNVHASRKVKTPTMSIKDLFRASEDAELGAKWVELPYDGYDFSMILVLPTTDHNLADVVSRMTLAHLNNMMNTRVTKEVNLKLPRFKLNADIPMVTSLKNLGLVDIFDQRSNLEGISTSKGPLIVSDIVHKAEIEVNEEGTEASGATGIVVNTLSLAPEYELVDFFATQPFLAIIVDQVNKMPIFVARVTDPTRP